MTRIEIKPSGKVLFSLPQDQELLEAALELARENTELWIEVKQLRGENFALATHQCKYPTGDEFGHPQCLEVERLTGEVSKLLKTCQDDDVVLKQRSEEIERLQTEVKRLQGNFSHFHVDNKLDDRCALCGHGVADVIHLRSR